MGLAWLLCVFGAGARQGQRAQGVRGLGVLPDDNALTKNQQYQPRTISALSGIASANSELPQ